MSYLSIIMPQSYQNRHLSHQILQNKYKQQKNFKTLKLKPSKRWCSLNPQNPSCLKKLKIFITLIIKSAGYRCPTNEIDHDTNKYHALCC